MAEDDVFDLGRIHVLPAGDDHVLGPVLDVNVPFAVDRRDVAGIQPAAADGLRRRVRPVPVALHQVLAAYDHLAGFAGPHVVARLVDHAHLGVKIGLAGRSLLRQRDVGVGQARRPARFCEAVDLVDLDAVFDVLLNQRHRHGRGAAHDPAQLRVVVLAQIRGLQHEIQHGRHGQHRGDPLLVNQLPYPHGVERPHHDHRDAAVDHGGHRRKRADVVQRQRLQVAVAVARVGRRADGNAGPNRRVVRMHGALGQAGRPRRVHDVEQVVFVGPDRGFGVGRRGLQVVVGHRKGVTRRRIADMDPMLDGRCVSTAAVQRIDRVCEFAAVQQHGCAAILQDERQFVRGQPPIQRDHDRA